MTDHFIDTNVLIYLFSSDLIKVEQAEKVVERGGVISVQILNELSNVARRKLHFAWHEAHETLTVVRVLLAVQPVTIESHEPGVRIAEKYGFSLNYSMIVSAALLSKCTRLYSEDMQDGQVVENTLRIQNPFHDDQAG